MFLSVEVKPNHISQGLRLDELHCPVAYALKDALGYEVEVCDKGWVYSRQSKKCLGWLPSWVWNQVVEYDKGGEFTPLGFQFRIDE